ncbi:circadian clock protein KaiC [Phycisphaerales bacterium AB-hyl4]|uniref:non-specific serine/threonine protein kinase n=1 Tax=Natronomicrosphaera hydrolytica TaxID=3242702 RepID=A0ABV4U094_9BACT
MAESKSSDLKGTGAKGPDSQSNTDHRLKTGIPGLDALTRGGLVRGRAAVLCGASGTGKTVMCGQYLAAGVEQFGEAGVYVTFEESVADLRENLSRFGWDVAGMESAKKLLFVDASPRADENEVVVKGDYDLAALRARVLYAIEQVQATRVAVDSLAALFMRFPDVGIVRRELFRLTSALNEAGVTTLMTTEQLPGESDRLSRFGVEEFVADSVMLIRNVPEISRRRRTLEVLKMRGSDHASGAFPFSISSDGIQTIPLGTLKLEQPSTDKRISSGCKALDAMCGGGFFRDSVTIVSGATGTGKTLTAMQFLRGAAEQSERAVVFGYEESRPQLMRNAESWGIDLEGMEKDGLVEIHCQFPESGSLEDHLARVRSVIKRFKAQRVVVDSITALQRIGSVSAFREFALGLTSMLKEAQVAGLYTSTSDSLFGSRSVTEQHISTLTDAILLLRYVEFKGEMHRGVTVLKMRGSAHDKSIRQFRITSEGMDIGEPFADMAGILAGHLSILGDQG